MRSVLFALLFLCSIGHTSERPNILFLICDDASRDSFGAYGCEYIETPGFDRIAREGVLFEQAYNCNPKCAPARACLLTGRYSWQLEETCNHNPFLGDQWQFYPFILEAAGYRIGYTGKGWGPGTWRGYNAAGDNKKANPAGHPWNDLKKKPPYKGISSTDYAANFAAFLKAAEEGDDQPFCFWLGTKEPHRGYGLDNWKLDGRDLSKVEVPAYYPDNETIRGDLADYAIEVEWYDQHIQQALAHLEETEQLENTIIIATSDHGMPFPRVKGQVYDDGFRVPFAVRWGDKVKAGRTVTDFITFPDLAPTLLDIAGVDAPTQMTGQSFLPQLLASESGRIDAERDHTLLGKERHDIGRVDGDILSASYPVRAIRDDRFLYAKNFIPSRWPVGDPEYGFKNCDASPTKTYLTETAKESEKENQYYELAFGKRAEEELYDIQTDPDCVTNLATDPDYGEIKSQLWEKLESGLKAHGDPRIVGGAEIFDHYPYSKFDKEQELYGTPDTSPERFKNSPYAERGFTPIFNGKDLTGWDAKPGAWTVRDGEIHCTGESVEKNWLIYRGQKPGDFVLRLDFKWTAGNSGVQIRSDDHGDWQVYGYQVEIAQQPKMGLFHHSIMPKEHPKKKARHLMTTAGELATIDAAGVRTNSKLIEDPATVQAHYRENEWNTMEITAAGDTITQRINGEVFAILVDRDSEESRRQGLIALQDHGKGCQVAFRNVRLKTSWPGIASNYSF